MGQKGNSRSDSIILPNQQYPSARTIPAAIRGIQCRRDEAAVFENGQQGADQAL
jgi:hypothetical protein